MKLKKLTALKQLRIELKDYLPFLLPLLIKHV